MRNNEYEQIKKCAKEIYEKKLINEGFISYNNEGLSWYKVINGCILQSVYLHSPFSGAPLFMEEGYGCHPLFIPAPIPRKVLGESYEDETMLRVRKELRYRTYEGTQVMCRNTVERGAEVLDTDVFPVFRKVRTEEDAYKLHRERCMETIAWYNRRSPGEPLQIIGSEWLADEAIYFDDNEMQRMMIDQLIYQRECMKSGDMMSTPTKREWYQKRIEAIQDGAREPFLMMLEARKKRFIRDLERKVGIQI